MIEPLQGKQFKLPSTLYIEQSFKKKKEEENINFIY